MKIPPWLFLLVCLLSSARADFYGYHEYASPDEKYVAQFNRSDREVVLVIKNRLSKKEEFFTKTLISSVEYVQWSLDSKSLIVIQHLAGGSTATLLHRNNKHEWINYDCDPPLHMTYKGSVADIKFLKEVFQLTYIVCPTTPNGAIIDFQLYVYNVCYDTGEMTLKKWHPITEKEFVILHTAVGERWEKWQKETR